MLPFFNISREIVMQMQLVEKTKSKKSETPVSLDLADALGARTGDRFKVAIQERNQHGITEHRSLILQVIRPSRGAEREFRVVRSNSMAYPAGEQWGIPVSSIWGELSVDSSKNPQTFLKQFKLWMALRTILREQGKWIDIVLP